MLKNLIALVLILSFIKAASCQSRDTSVAYFTNKGVIVTTVDSADFVRFILPPDSGSNLYNIKEIYKNGQIKLIGKSNPILLDKLNVGSNSLMPSLQGSCITYYPSGKRKRIANYNQGVLEGLYMEYYPNGKLYKVENFTRNGRVNELKECYDSTGVTIAQNGKGHWIDYEDDFNTVAFEGNINNGSKTGEWHGLTRDGIKYNCKYRNDIAISGESQDKNGKVYHFNRVIESAYYNLDGSKFFIYIYDHTKVPRDENGREITLGTVPASFIVDKTGHIKNVRLPTSLNPSVAKAVIEALNKCPVWKPAYRLGMPADANIRCQFDFNNPKINSLEDAIILTQQIQIDN